MSFGKIIPDWSAPKNILAFSTTRQGGVSKGLYDSFNIGKTCGDDPDAVVKNRAQLSSALPQEPYWLHQIHSAKVVRVEPHVTIPKADASYTDVPGQVCSVQTADCLPVLVCAADGTEVAAIHAGWRSLQAGIIPACFKKLKTKPSNCFVYLGPAISQTHFEVGPEVHQQFIQTDAKLAEYFIPGRADRYQADLYAIARHQLRELGVTEISGGSFCTYQDQDRFFSYRRDGKHSGRMVSVIAILE